AGTTFDASAAADRKTVSYRGVSVQVPSDWPVVDLTEKPARCARFDVSVVYLGRQSDEAICPALLLGAAEAVHIEPWDDTTDMRAARRREINGEPALVDESGLMGGRIVVGLDRARTIVRVVFGDDEALAHEIVNRIQAGEGSAPGSTPDTRQPEAPAVPGPAPPLPGFTVAETNPAPLQPGIFAGDAFDTCANPALEKMEAWLSSPYRAIGIYVGGINHGCKAQTLDAGWVADTARLGWSFLPLYVGRQAPCYSGSAVLIDPGSAASQGTAAADDAIAQADKYGLPTGSPLYFDMEAYSGTASCKTAVHTFLQAWTIRLHARGYTSGVYSSEASGVANLAAAYDDPGFV
ncbi:MAG: glycoside hydrolase domain-containing protein, partial [Actinomycetota bacterium]